MNTFVENGRFRSTQAIPRMYDKLYTKMFDTFLNIPSSHELPDLDNEFIKGFVMLFKPELGNTFNKSKKYLEEMNKHFK